MPTGLNSFKGQPFPDANSLTIGIFALLAQHERELISNRTKADLQQKEIQGFILGKPGDLRLEGLRVRQQYACSHKANRQATELIVMYREKGMNYQAIAERLNSHGFTTRRGKQFFPITVQRLYQRHKHLPVDPLCLKI